MAVVTAGTKRKAESDGAIHSPENSPKRLKLSLDEQFLNAVKSGNIADVQRALDAGADLMTSTENGETAIDMATVYDNVAILSLLLSRAAQILNPETKEDFVDS